MAVVDEFFSHPDYRGDERRISEYATWAVSENGPVLWKKPILMTIEGSNESENFVGVSLRCWYNFTESTHIF
jgi:hypothetical protein